MTALLFLVGPYFLVNVQADFYKLFTYEEMDFYVMWLNDTIIIHIDLSYILYYNLDCLMNTAMP